MKKPVIYKIRNVVNDKFYVGSTNDTRERFRCHRRRLRSGKHHSQYLQNAWNKYGEDCFRFEIVEEVDSQDKLQAAEDVWLSAHVGKRYCYNVGRCSDAPWRGVPSEAHPCYGRVVSADQRAAISSKVRQRYQDPDYNPRRGTIHSTETKAKIAAKVQQALAEGRGGKFIPTEETRRKMSLALKGNKNSLGKTKSEETRRKLSASLSGNPKLLGRVPPNKKDLSTAYAKFPEEVRAKYDFSTAAYTQALEPITGVLCPEHGEFQQYAAQFRKGRGCPQCGHDVRGARKRLTKEEFVQRCNDVHNNWYSYEKTQFEVMRDRIVVTCPEHGDFELTALKHLYSKNGCVKCRARRHRARVVDTAP